MKAYFRPRPVRVAYLVEETEHWQTILDAIAATSFAQWGGRFTLIIPCENGGIRPAYLPWLKAYDADVIYSYVDLSDAAIERFTKNSVPPFSSGTSSICARSGTGMPTDQICPLRH